MKKFTSFILAAALGMALLTGCGPEKPAETSAAGSADSQTAAASSDAEASVPETSEKESSEAAAAGKESSGGSGDGTVIRVGGLKGPTTMGLVKLMDDAENGKAQNDYEFTMVTAADELTALVAGNKVDIALLPANVAGVLYNKTKGGISVIDVNTLGVLYLVSSDTSVTSIDQLKGKTIYLTGKGTTPEYSLRYLMSAAGLTEDDVTLEFKSEPAEVASVLAEDPSRIGLLPQPFVTSALAQNESLSVILDLTKAWDASLKPTRRSCGRPYATPLTGQAPLTNFQLCFCSRESPSRRAGGGCPISRRTEPSPLPPGSWGMILTVPPSLPFWSRTPTEPPNRPHPYPNTPVA